MRDLIIIEIIKLLHSKSIYVIYCLIIFFIVLNSVLVYSDDISNDNYIENAMDSYNSSLEIINKYSDIEKLDYSDKLIYRENIKSMNINKYIMDNNININNYKSLSYQYRYVLDDYYIFIVILVLIISSSIISNEITKGSIKLLLIKPYTRKEILLSKYITIFIVMIISIIFMYLSELLIGGYFLGFKSIDYDIVVYNYSKSKIMCYNIFVYSLVRVLVKIPELILLYSFSYLVSIITSSKIISLILSLFIYLFKDNIMNITVTYNIKLFKYLFILNGDFTCYLFGGISSYKYINIKLSIIVSILHFMLMLVFSIIIFNKKDIRSV